MRELAVALLKISGTSKVVMQRRSADDKIAPGLIGCFGGHIDKGETPAQALVRELKEETSLSIAESDLELLSVTDIPYSSEFKGSLRAHLFEVQIPSSDFILYDGVRAEVFSLVELLQRPDLTPSAKLVLSKIGQ
jgi:8-oxo-dGTP pyrophosphatase MutT (NUDIX family)